MNNILKKLKEFFLNPINLKVFFILIPLLLEIPIFIPILNPYFKIGLVWAALFLLYDIFHEKRLIQIKGSRYLIAFILTYIISIFLNRKIQLKMNLIGLFYIITIFFVLLIPTKKPLIKNEIRKLNLIIIKITGVVSTMGLLLYAIQFFNDFTYLNTVYRIGFYSNRLIGFYRGVTTPITAIAIMVSVIQLTIVYQEKSQDYIWPVYTLMINFIHTGLSNSKGIFIGLYVFIGVFVFFLTYGSFLTKNLWKKLAFSAILIFVSVFLVNSTFKITRTVASHVPYRLNQIYNFSDDDTLKDEPIDLDREVSDDYDVFTGRPHIWKLGLERFTKKPVFGYGAYTTAKTISLPFSDQSFSTYHNFYIHTLVSAGILGFISLMSFILIKVYKTLQYLLTHNIKDDNYLLISSISAMLAFYAVTNMGETTILYMNKFSEFVFWIYLGYVSSYITQSNIMTHDNNNIDY